MYKNGDYVRTSKYKHIFEKGYENNWGDEIFKVVQVIRRNLYSATHRKLFIYLQTATFCAQKLCAAPNFQGSRFTDYLKSN
jgi:hypothetical protein